ncbi:hypothetical protein E4U52_003403 [Claviceps spartinae]|nr:hypothetical protein E4U52_003403 [Claviceps spartinae]
MSTKVSRRTNKVRRKGGPLPTDKAGTISTIRAEERKAQCIRNPGRNMTMRAARGNNRGRARRPNEMRRAGGGW